MTTGTDRVILQQTDCGLTQFQVTFRLPDFKASVISDYVSQFSPSFAARLVQHLTEPPHQRLLQQAHPRRSVVRTIRHGNQQGKCTINALVLARTLQLLASRQTVYFLEDTGSSTHLRS